jgi:hypothetical protein
VYEHRFVIEKATGKKLQTDQEVHHINGIKTDNRISNLQILSKDEHYKLHNSLAKNSCDFKASFETMLGYRIKSIKLQKNADFLEKVFAAIPENPSIVDLLCVYFYCKTLSQLFEGPYIFDFSLFKSLSDVMSETFKQLGFDEKDKMGIEEITTLSMVIELIEPIIMSITPKEK